MAYDKTRAETDKTKLLLRTLEMNSLRSMNGAAVEGQKIREKSGIVE